MKVLVLIDILILNSIGHYWVKGASGHPQSVIFSTDYLEYCMMSVYQNKQQLNDDTTWVRQPFVNVSIPCIIHHSNVLPCLLSQYKLTRLGMPLEYTSVFRGNFSFKNGMDTFSGIPHSIALFKSYKTLYVPDWTKIGHLRNAQAHYH